MSATNLRTPGVSLPILLPRLTTAAVPGATSYPISTHHHCMTSTSTFLAAASWRKTTGPNGCTPSSSPPSGSRLCARPEAVLSKSTWRWLLCGGLEAELGVWRGNEPQSRLPAAAVCPFRTSKPSPCVISVRRAPVGLMTPVSRQSWTHDTHTPRSPPLSGYLGRRPHLGAAVEHGQVIRG